MTKTQKVELLYRKAKGEAIYVSPDAMQELSVYKVAKREDEFISTKNNIRQYVEAVDAGCTLSFYDWCINNGKADKRRKGSSEKEIAIRSKETTCSAICFGWLTWGMAIHAITFRMLPVELCAICAIIVSIMISKYSRRWMLFKLVFLPLIIIAVLVV